MNATTISAANGTTHGKAASGARGLASAMHGKAHGAAADTAHGAAAEEPGTPAAKDKVVLAYSGGLDTSVCIKWLQEEWGLDVVALCGNVGQDESDLKAIKQKALDLGAIASEAIDMRAEYAAGYLAKAIAANGLYEGYPLLSALSRPLIAKHLVDAAHAHGARFVAHGCTGKGNDQVRFETSIKALDPTLTILAPVREWDLHTREDEIAWATAHGVPVRASKEQPYSIDDNLWGRAIECGALENPACEPPADIWTMTADPQDAPEQPECLTIGFEKGIPCSLDGKKAALLDIVQRMNLIVGAHGYGRLDMVENRLVGVKSRECYEAPAALALIAAHKALESLCLEREAQHFKAGIEQQWGTCVYNGQWYSPLKDALDAFCAQTQAFVTGSVKLRLYKGSCTVVGRESPYSLYDLGLASYTAEDTFDHEAAAGFIELHSLPTSVWAAKQGHGANGVHAKTQASSGETCANETCAAAQETGEQSAAAQAAAQEAAKNPTSATTAAPAVKTTPAIPLAAVA